MGEWVGINIDHGRDLISVLEEKKPRALHS